MKNPFDLPSKRRPGFDTLGRAMKDSLKQPFIGVTQGGSSRKNSGARVAATSSVTKQPRGK